MTTGSRWTKLGSSPPLAVHHWEVESVSIVRIGLGETKGFGDGYEAIFGKKKTTGGKKPVKARSKPPARKAGKKK
jgi:hypothetical protein